MSTSTDAVVIGLGYVGLSLAQAMTRAGLSTIGLDRDESIVDALSAGHSHVSDVSDSELTAMRSNGFAATTDETMIGLATTVVICVPTPLHADGGPDLAAVEEASRAVARQLRPGMLVILESTSYPGTTDEVVRPILEGSGLVAGADFHLAFSPERVDPGNRTFRITNTPKVVGGYTPSCTRLAAAFYGRFVDTVVPATGTREAELAKLLENTYRYVNIALVNELARVSRELHTDIWEAIRLAATKPFGFQAFYPGPGVGGHCIPIDPNYLSHRVRAQLGRPLRLVELAEQINSSMPGYIASRAQDLLNHGGLSINGASVLLLGVTYKPDVADRRESPAIPLVQQLDALGAKVTYHDPYLRDWHVPGIGVVRADDLAAAVAAADLVILLQNHRAYDADHLARSASRFLDTRGVTTGETTERL
jgi:UDP-N-acetyl-D-glucosamine dehydrogenase